MFPVSSLPIATVSEYQLPEGSAMLVGIGIGLLAVLLFVPHFLAARLLAENRTFGRICATIGIHLVLAIVAVLVAVFLFAWNPLLLLAGALVYLLVGGAITAQIYQFGLGRGIAYNILVNVFAKFISLAIPYVVPEGAEKLAESFKRKAAPLENTAPQRSFQTVEQAKLAAVQQFPELGKQGSEFNRAFLAKHSAYKATNPAYFQGNDWPWRLAHEVADDTKSH